MTNLRHLVFLEKKLVSIENKDGTNLNINNIIDVSGDELFLFLLESSGTVWICYKPWAKFNETTHLRFINFKSFEYEATHIFYCSLKRLLIIIGREQECDLMLKFNSYDLLPLMNGNKFENVPQFVQSTPLFPNLAEFRVESNLKVEVSDCGTYVAIPTEFNGIYIYRNYMVPNEDQKLYAIPLSKLFSGPSNSPENRPNAPFVKNLHLFGHDNSFYLFVLTDYEVVTYSLKESSVVFRESSETKYEVSCKLRNNLVAIYKSNRILIYNLLKGVYKYIDTTNGTEGVEGTVSDEGLKSKVGNSVQNNLKLHCFNEYVINCNIDNIFDNNNIILINVYSYLLDISFVAYSYHIPRLIYMVQAMNNLYLFTTNIYGANNLNKSGNKELIANPNNNILIFELKNKKIYERIEILIRKRLFKWAIKLAEFEKRPKNEVEEIYKIYADWLYQKNKFNEAINYYCKSNNSVEPCYVIQRFLVLNSKIYLYKYLYYLHLNNKDNYILTILLIKSLNNLYYYNFNNSSEEDNRVNKEYYDVTNINYDNINKEFEMYRNHNKEDSTNGVSYTEESKELELESILELNVNNLKNKDELHKFLNKFGTTHKNSIKEAIVECRNTNKFLFASLIAKHQNDSEELLNILIEDLNDFESAYKLLEDVDNNIKYKVVIKHYKLLLNYSPNKLLKLIQSIITANSGNKQLSGTTSTNNKLFNNKLTDKNEREEGVNMDKLIKTFILENKFLLMLLQIIDKNASGNSLLLYTIKLSILLQQYKSVNNSQISNTSNPNHSYNNSNSNNPNDTGDKEVLDDDNELIKIEDNILKLLNNSVVDEKNELVSLLLCLLYDYKRGSIITSIKMGHYNFPLILLDKRDEGFNLVDYVLNYGYNEPVLYLNILKLLLKCDNYLVLKKLLYNIQNYKLLKYQNIIGIFNTYQHIQFQYIQDYVRNEFKKIKDMIQEYNNDIKQDRIEYMSMKKNLLNLNNNYIIINNINCSSCGLYLEYPSVHFYCKHSYHIYCVPQDNMCPKCSYNLLDNNDNDDNFFKFLVGSNDPFDYISQQFNKLLNIT